MNNNKVFLYRHNPASQGAKILARTLGIKMIKPDNTAFKPAEDKAVINWGCGRPLPFDTRELTVINQPERVANATNKLRFFEICREARSIEIPRFTRRRVEAEDLLRDCGALFLRTKLQGSCGEGIVEILSDDDLQRENREGLFVEYIKKKFEFRIHVGDGKVIDRQQKKKRNDVDLEDINWRIRSHANGFVFARSDISVPKCVDEQALAAMEVIGLDFGAVDVIYNQHHKKAYVLEINTAPGLEGSTVLSYKNYFTKKLGIESDVEDVYDVIELARRHGIEVNR